MSLKSAIFSNVTAKLTSERRLEASRVRAERKRVRAGSGHVLEYFHQVDDPYSHLAAQALLEVSRRYSVEIRPYLVGLPADWAAPEREKLVKYARLDAARLSRVSGLSFADPGSQPDTGKVYRAAAFLAGTIGDHDWLERAVAAGEALWTGGDIPEPGSNGPQPAWEQGEARRDSLGHFMSAMIHYAGEWYWGVDRLHYLEARLMSLGASRPGMPDVLAFLPPVSPSSEMRRTGAELHWYLSFRSPYTYIAAERIKAMAETYGAELRLRFVLPMVMRGLPVPRMKQVYFMLDAAREAKRAGVPFGRIADPVGKPVERGYSLIPWAREQERGMDFVLSFMRAVWSEGVDAGSDRGMRRIVERAGLDWTRARDIIGNEDWRQEAEANRAEMMQLGLWGVPCVRVGETAAWGQDRLWVAEAALQAFPDKAPRLHREGSDARDQ